VRKLPAKHIDLMILIRNCVSSGNYVDSSHAIDRQNERGILRLEIVFVLENGRHEKSKDKFDELHAAWNYAIRGKTIDKRDLRIIVSFDEVTNLLIITAIELKD
jgi:hypothetical protein